MKKITKNIFLKTFGCQMNEYDTELIRTILLEDNFVFVDSEQDADIVMLNTCTVRENANRKVYNQIHNIRRANNGRPFLIGVLGCMATNFKEKLLEDKRLKIDFIAGPDSYRKLPGLIREAHQERSKASHVGLQKSETYSGIYPTRIEGANAWVAVMRGCDNFCSFCIVPYVRGRERSRLPASVIDEVNKLAFEGFKQVTLLGQNVNSYKYKDKDFADLIEDISKIEGVSRVRFMSPHPKDFPKKLLDSIATNKKVCKHIHLPLQAGSNRILKMMNRGYTKEDYLDLVQQIRSLVPEIAITTDIIAGFPTETDSEFEDTYSLIKEVEFDSAFIFKYSPREGTSAHRKYKDDVPDRKKGQRTHKLNETQKKISLGKNKTYIGKVESVLVEQESTQKSANDFQGRTDTNKLVILKKGPYHVGQFIDVKITDATANVLKGEVT